MEHSTKVKNYYENNTRRFLLFHRDAATKSIHQPLWKEKYFSLKQAYSYANYLILKEIQEYQSKETLTIIDLGCGVGSSIFYLAEQLEKAAIYYGISISATQIKIAKERAEIPLQNQNILSRIHFIEADFTKLPNEISSIDIAFSIEAFVHASDAENYFESTSQKLKKGGKIILIDDFLNDEINFETLDIKSKKAVADFKYGWVLNSLKTKKDLNAIADKFDLKIVEETDLTPYLRINTLKHQWIHFLVTTFRWLYELLPWKSYYFRSWIGGNAKQYCLRNEIVKYKKLVFEKY